MPSFQQPTHNTLPSDTASEPRNSAHSDQAQIIERLELLAEKAHIEIEKQSIGRLLVKKVVREKTVQIPVILTEEVLVIEYQENTALTDSTTYPEHVTRIQLNGETITLSHNQSIELPIYREEAAVHKKVVVTEHVDIGKLTRQHTVTHSVELRHEELDVEEQHVPPANLIASESNN